MIRENLKLLTERVETSARRAAREPGTVKIVLVTKNIPVDRIREAYDCGFRVFGENRVQEFLEKFPALPSDITWHLIGHLQTNKVKYIADKISLIHSVDSVKLAEELEKRAALIGRNIRVLLEVNTSGEASKFGFSPDGVAGSFSNIKALPHLEVLGLMTIGPLTEDKVTSREAFRSLKVTKEKIEQNFGVSLPELSMGMSGDYEIAIEEGSTMVRIGTVVFGLPRWR
ncbi:MAG: YggS family pyridoxal phosphate-dependent enzyme [Candidatus Omnitrophica bacterium]|nr:YggS family pyridoxal phosphate-dependent enzyme [Candidatus Omnitrophota bacterium]